MKLMVFLCWSIKEICIYYKPRKEITRRLLYSTIVLKQFLFKSRPNYPLSVEPGLELELRDRSWRRLETGRQCPH
jgi:hypothetical protein